MTKRKKTCYMCGAKKTSKEHVPPQCLFPETKDTQNGIDYRKNLLTVPSCDIHNSSKSHDDEYLLYILNCNIHINEVGREHYRTKIRRAVKNSSSILSSFANVAESVTTIDPNTNEDVETVAFELDRERVDRIMDNLARAIYFKHYKEKWLIDIKYDAEFLLKDTDIKNGEANLSGRKLRTQQTDELFKGEMYYGDNPKVFKYQAVETSTGRVMRLYFYEGSKIMFIFNNSPQRN